MQKTLLASAIGLALGTAATVQAAQITITQMDFNGLYAASGALNDAGNGSMTSVDPFYGNHWTADQVVWFNDHSGPSEWDASGYANGGIYNFTLTGNQVAAGTLFDWNANLDIAVLTIFDCAAGGGACTGASLPMAGGPFKGQSPGFNGLTADDFPISNGGGTNPVPVPAAAWLFGSGLVGLVGVARRRRKA